MPCRPAHPWQSTRAVLLLLAALAGSVSCTSSSGDEDGTPLPEPPDGLPRPQWVSLEGNPVATDLGASADLLPVSLGGDQIRVQPGSQVWAINLDQPSVPPAITTAMADGRFALGTMGTANDRIRILARAEDKHSPPLDLVVLVERARVPPAFVTMATGLQLPCFSVTPTESLELSGSEGELTLRNQCSGALEITKASLRFGDRGITLGDVPPSIAPGEQVTLTFQDSAGPGASERLDILLLEVDAGDPIPRKYAIDVFTDLE